MLLPLPVLLEVLMFAYILDTSIARDIPRIADDIDLVYRPFAPHELAVYVVQLSS